ncbi:MAG: PatB family C-S lyase [Rikenellaceae bacterium]|nr:PatB family C-S lyase [Rikenellaceae bacterium]
MKFDFDKETDRRGTSCYKWDKRTELFGRGDVIPMWVADMDFEVAPCITRAIKNRAEHAVYGYDFRGDGFFEAVSGWIGRRSGWKTQKEWMVYTPGVVAGLVFAQRAFSKKGDRVVIQPPVYPPFAGTVRENGRTLVENPLVVSDGTFGIDFEDLDRKLEGAKVFLLCNPHNPSGRVFIREELEKVGRLCVKHDVIIVADEIHSDLVFDGHPHIHMASLSPEIARRTVTLIAPSKTFNIAGLSTSVAIIPDQKMRERYAAVLGATHTIEGNSFGNVALTAAYNQGEEWLDQLRPYLYGNYELVRDFIASNIPSVGTYPLEGTYLMWLDFSKWNMPGEKLQEFLTKKAGLGLNDGRTFGREGLHHARMNLATRRALVKQALEQLHKACLEEGLV